jgi:DNA mismatch endonuclease (patch repair protein)
MDIKSKEDRSINMSRIRSKNTRPEMYIRRLLYGCGYRYRVNYSKISGTPDIYFISRKIAVYVNGCFWHRHSDCKYAYTPKSNVDSWQKKFADNIQRDQRIVADLELHNIRYLIIWECTIHKMMKSVEYKNCIMNEIKEFIDTTELNHLEL